MADFYELLGVSRDADADTLKRAYRQQARKYHPDVNKEAGAEEKFKEIGKAYEVLSDSQKRARYDQFGEAGLGGAAGMPDMGDMGGFADLFETFFNGFGGPGSAGGSRPQRRGPQQGDDLRYDLTIDFDNNPTINVRRKVLANPSDFVEKLNMCDQISQPIFYENLEDYNFDELDNIITNWKSWFKTINRNLELDDLRDYWLKRVVN